MASSATPLARLYCFNVFTQTYGREYVKNSVLIKVTDPDKIDPKVLATIIKRMGNRIALLEVKSRSQDTEHNYCNDYTKHIATCAQAPYQFCRRHLTPEEIQEIDTLTKPVFPANEAGIEYSVQSMSIERGDIDQMRRIFACACAALKSQKA